MLRTYFDINKLASDVKKLVEFMINSSGVSGNIENDLRFIRSLKMD